MEKKGLGIPNKFESKYLYHEAERLVDMIFISFDFDRTLGDYSKAHGNSILEAIHVTFNRKFQVNWFDISSAGLTDLQIITNLVHNHGISLNTIFQNLNLCLYNINKNFNKYLKTYPIELLDHAKETVESLSNRDDTIIGISTGNIKTISIKKLVYTGIEHYFFFGSYGSEVFNRYQLLRLTKNRLIQDFNFTSNDIAIHVGDAVLDILSAKKAGFIPIGVTTGNYSREQLQRAGAAFVFDKISDLEKNFDEISYSIQNNANLKTLLV